MNVLWPLEFPIIARGGKLVQDALPDIYPSLATLVRVGLALLGLAAAILWERARPFRRAQPTRLRHDASNLSLWLANALFLQLVFGAVSVGTALLSQRSGLGLLHHTAWPFLWKLALTLLVLDLTTYSLHRLYHLVPILWRLHLVHHSDADLDATTGVRFHTLEIGLSTCVRLGVVFALGATPLGVIVYEASLLLASQLQHANVRLTMRIDQLLRSLVITPNMHRIHHSVRRSELDSNYGTILSCWDRIFGSYRSHPDVEEVRVGLPGFAPELSLLGLLAMPFVALPSEHSSDLARSARSRDA